MGEKKNFTVDKGHNFKGFCNQMANKFAKVAKKLINRNQEGSPFEKGLS